MPSSSVLHGTVDILILKTLSWQPMHGYAISGWISNRSAGAIEVEGAALYQALHRLERRKLVTPEWGVSENNRRAKYYAITPEGRKVLRNESSTWRSYAAAVAAVLDAPRPGAA
ncbi:MAG: PadR family transcriptional regulator [Gemmatimonadaceae bacterium]